MIFRQRRRKAQAPLRLVHVGPHKTGTTTVQGAFHRNREALAEHGVHYTGPALQPSTAVKAVTGMVTGGEDRAAGLAQWDELMAEARRHDGTVVLSSEFLCEADATAARKVVDDIGPDNVRVVVTLRPLSKILPSQWQQLVQTGSERSFGDWLELVMSPTDGSRPALRFWQRHRHDELVERWAGVVGPENVTVIVGDSGDPSQLLREFGRLLDLSEGILVPFRAVHNRSLTWEEAEAIRAFNIEYNHRNAQRREKGKEPLVLTVDERLAAWRSLKQRPPGTDDTRVTLPTAFDEKVGMIAREMVERLTSSGVEIVGDLGSLTDLPRRSGGADPAQPSSIPPHVSGLIASALVWRLQQAP